jgi:hypothetical protein
MDNASIGLVALAVSLAGAVWWGASLAAIRLLPTSGVSSRAVAAWTIAVAWQVTTFHGLTAAGWYSPTAVVVTTTGAAFACHWRWSAVASSRMARDVGAMVAVWRRLGWWRVVAVAVCLPAATRLLRALVSPSLAWDALTYHLPRAVEWIQSGTAVALPGPDAAAYYRYFPPVGEILLAAAMMITRSDALLAGAGAWQWLGVWVGVVALARTVGASRQSALAAAAVVATVPAVAGFVGASYVDNAALAMFLAALTFAARTVRGWRLTDATLTGLALGLLLGTKGSAVPIAACVVAWLSVAALCRRPPRLVAAARGHRAAQGAAVAGMLACVLVAAPPMVRALRETGNPLYPLTVRVGTRTMLTGDPQLAELMRYGAWRGDAILRALFSPARMAPDHDHLGFGPATLVLVPAALVGAWRSRRRYLTAGLFAAAAAVVVPTFLPDARGLWALWPATTPRLVSGALAVAASVAARSSAAWLLWMVALATAPLAVPWGVGHFEREAAVEAWPAFVALAAGGVLLAALWSRHRRAVAASMLGTALVAAVMLAAPARSRNRWSIYEDAAHARSFDLHALGSHESAAWPLWRALDREPPARVAVAAGFAGAGHNWYRFPLYGNRLQHDVIYVPVTADGRLVSYRDLTFAQMACATCWQDRLAREGVDLVVGLPPTPPEVAWLEDAPERFVRLPETGSAVAFRIAAGAL